MEENILFAVKHSREFMNNDKVIPKTQQDVVAILNNILNAKKSVNRIEKILEEICEDNNIDISDIPNFILLFLECKDFLCNGISSVTLANNMNLKYLCYGIMMYGFKFCGFDFSDVSMELFEKNYNTLWKLVELNISVIEKVKSGKCC